VAGRRSVWNDPRVIEKVLSFTPATDEVWRLQRHPDKECQFFRQQVAGRTTPIGGSWQGLYVFSPSGKLLVRQNTLQADKALILLEKGLAAWEALPAEERLPIDPFIYEPAHRWELFYPSDGLVLRSTSRDLPEKGLRSETRGRWNRDHIWFHHSELKEWIPTSLKSGQVHSLPAGLAMRLARFHIVDNVSGQEGPFSPEDIEKAEVTITVGDREADKVTLLLSGEFRSESDGVYKLGETDWKHFPSRTRGVSAELVGIATWNSTSLRFESFEAAVSGKVWGGSGLNGRRGITEVKPARVGWFLEMTGDSPSSKLAPAFVDVYGADWIKPPTP